MMVKKRKPSLRHKLFLGKEIVLALLAFVSIGLVLFEFIKDPGPEVSKTLNHIDIVIACIFLSDFLLSILFTGDRRKYLKHNWYFLLAAIPISDSIAEVLRGIRLLRLFRLIRAGEHLDYSVTKK